MQTANYENHANLKCSPASAFFLSLSPVLHFSPNLIIFCFTNLNKFSLILKEPINKVRKNLLKLPM